MFHIHYSVLLYTQLVQHKEKAVKDMESLSQGLQEEEVKEVLYP